VFEVILLLALSLTILVRGGNSGLSATPFTWPGGSKDVLLAFSLAVLAFGGFEAAAPLAEETRNPRRNVPLAVLGAVVISGIIYVVGSYALVAQRHMHEYGTTSEQLAEIAVTMRRHASLNPQAKYRDPITVEDVLASRVISSPLHLLDCCVISDGGGALVLTSLERARDLKKPPVVVLGAAEALRHAEIGTRDLLDIAARQSGPLALARAGITHADVDLAMVYDSYTITVLATLEALGFCAPGEGGAFCAGGRIGLGGALPVNPDGGGLSSNHPGMRGIFLVIEATRQLRGECGPRQVKDAKLVLVHGTGGMLGQRHSGVTMLLGRA